MNHPLSDMMTNSMSKIRDMIDVNTVVGDPITTPGGVTIIPVTKVSIGYGGGGSDFAMKNMPANRDNPFGGGAGAGIKITPVAFLVIRGENVRMLPVAEPASTSVDRLIELLPDLLEKGEAYYCFCTQERLDSLKKNVNGEEIMAYDKHCLGLSKEEVEANLKAGMPFVIRQNNPKEGTTTFHDDIYGDISVDNSELDDMVLIKSDGYPTYNFANVVDDHLMGITHVVRGNEYLSSSPKYNRLYEAFGWEVPVYVHCPTITNEEHKKLSKRSGHSSFEDLLEQGFLTEAIVNFVALLGWSPAGNQEFFTLEELVKEFDYHNMSKSPAVFDMTKLRWMNGEYLKKMDFEPFYAQAEPYLKAAITKPLDLKKIAAMVKTRIEVFPDIAAQVDFFETLPEYDPEMYVHKKMKTTKETSLETSASGGPGGLLQRRPL